MTIKRTLIALVCAVLAAGTPSSPAANPEETNPDAVALDPDYAAGKQALERKDWGEAAKRLGRAVLRDPDNADLHNDLGFAHRGAGGISRDASGESRLGCERSAQVVRQRWQIVDGASDIK